MADQLDENFTAKGFFNSLFDINFSSLIISRIVKIVYVIAIVLIGLEALVVIIGSLASRNIGVFIAALIIAPIAALFSLIWIRILLEIVIIIFRIGEDVRRISLAQGISDATTVDLAVSGYPAQAPAEQPRQVVVTSQRTVPESDSSSKAGTATAVPNVQQPSVQQSSVQEPSVQEPSVQQPTSASSGAERQAQNQGPSEATPRNDLPQAGWYHDPQQEGSLRFWDGQSWTDQRRPMPPA
jgi:Domain of unknown function (DUF4282)/Protein of unknown function (DUF2510)